MMMPLKRGIWKHLVALAMVAALGGCTRTDYRLAADREVYGLLRQKSNDPRWALKDYTIQMDPAARYFDPTCPDHPPMPQDDPASHRYMHCVDGKKGWPCWHANGDRRELENPRWRELLAEYNEFTDKGELKLPLDGAVRLALVHNPDYRSQIETLYLSALDVSAERFRFDVQPFAGNDTFFTHNGRDRLPGGERNILTTDTDFQIRRRFTTGAELLVGFANSFMWQFAGPDSNNTTSLLNFNLVQPLLRAGGRAVVMEQLTIVERALLGNLRAFQRYRQGFYTNIAIGQGVGGAQRRGGFFGGTGLTGFTGQGSGGFGEVGNITGFGQGGGGGQGGGADGGGVGFAGGGAGQVGGFIGLLQQVQQVRNTQDSLNAQERTLGLLEANLQAGLIDIAQVDQFRQNIQTERANLLQARNALENSLDTFKVATLGLPPDLSVQVDDTLIRQFQFIDPTTTTLQNQISDFISLLGDLPAQPSTEELAEAIEVLKTLQQRLARQSDRVGQDLQRFETTLEQRKANLSDEDAKVLVADGEKLREVFVELEARQQQATMAVNELEAALTGADTSRAADQLVTLAGATLGIVQEMALVQARARLESVTVDKIDLQPEKAVEVARVHRLDWMNNRAALVDTWRLIEFNANALLANLDIVFSGDMSTVGNNPVKFQAPTGQLRAGLRFDAPLTRLLERNNYRQVLINYQQDRRRLIRFDDTVYTSLRRLLRQLDQLATNLEIQRRAMVIAVRRVDQTREVLNEPPAPVAPGAQAAGLGPTAAQNLLTALSDLRNTQNNFMSVWLNYYATRMLLMRELGLMEIDDNNLWIDRPLKEYDLNVTADCSIPPAVPMQWMLDSKMQSGELETNDPSPIGVEEYSAEQASFANPVKKEEQAPHTEISDENELDLFDAPAASAGERAIRGQLNVPRPRSIDSGRDRPAGQRSHTAGAHGDASSFSIEKLQAASPLVLLTDSKPTAPRTPEQPGKQRASSRNKWP